MKVYTYKCESCGSKQYIKTKSGYKCKYCGSIQEVISAEKPDVGGPANVNEQVHVATSRGKINNLSNSAKTTLILFLVCIFAGTYGIHKFMEHKILLGVVYFFTFGLFGIGWFIDVIRYGIHLAEEYKCSGGE